MDKAKIIGELNANCRFKWFSESGCDEYVNCGWAENDIDNDYNIKPYCAKKRFNKNQECEYLSETICDECVKILNKYKNMYVKNTNTTNLAKILDRLDKIEIDIKQTKDRIEKDVQKIKEHLKIE